MSKINLKKKIFALILAMTMLLISIPLMTASAIEEEEDPTIPCFLTTGCSGTMVLLCTGFEYWQASKGVEHWVNVLGQVVCWGDIIANGTKGECSNCKKSTAMGYHSNCYEKHTTIPAGGCGYYSNNCVHK